MTESCPHLAGFEPFETSGGVKLLPALAAARREEPVFFLSDHEMWAVTRYEDIEPVLRDYRNFSTEPYRVEVEVPAEVAATMWPGYTGSITEDSLIPLSPPDHTRVRRAAQRAFGPGRMEELRPAVEAYADSLIDEFQGDGEVELVERFAGPFVVGVISDWFGLPQEWRGRFRDYTDTHVRQLNKAAFAMPEEERLADWRLMADFDRGFRDYIAERKENPADDLTSELMAAHDEDGTPLFTDTELWTLVVNLTSAAADTTANLICHAFQLLLENPEQWDALRTDPSLIPGAVEEVLRYRNGVTGGLFRKALRDVEVGGVEIPAGSILYLMVGSGNRDEAVFDAPDDFDIFRADARKHVAFGKGIHLCIGAPLARLEAVVALERFLERLPDLRLAEPDAELVYTPNLLLGKLVEFRVAW
jgi:cytochrome P450